MWRPALAPAVALAALAGWAVNEPEQAESLPIVYVGLGVPIAFGWLRAACRAVLSLLQARRACGPAVAVGLLTPRVQVDARFMRELDPEEQQAVLAHEEAHARHRDPLRIWLGQLVTDLQWPMPAAMGRYADWRAALELSRDEEARLDGADGGALASAIVKSFRLQTPRMAAVAGLGSIEADLAERVRRNLDRDVAADPLPPSLMARRLALVALILAAAFAGGLTAGESVVTFMAAASA